MKEKGITEEFLAEDKGTRGIKDLESENARKYAVNEEIDAITPLYQKFISSLKVDNSQGNQALYKRSEEGKYTEKRNNDLQVPLTQERFSFLNDVKTRLNIDFDTHFVDTILAGQTRAEGAYTGGCYRY